MSKPRVLTENQERFLSALFNEAEGNIPLAIKMAGYAEGTKSHAVISSLREEIIEGAQKILASGAVEAVFQQMDILRRPTQEGATTKQKAVQEILNRVGVQTKAEDVQLKVPSGGLFIMPAKGTVVHDGNEVTKGSQSLDDKGSSVPVEEEVKDAE